MHRKRIIHRPRPALPGSDSTGIPEADALLRQGRIEDAAEVFASLCRQGSMRRQPRRLAELHVFAAHAYADTGKAEQALYHARQALGLFVQLNRPRRAAQFTVNIVRKLRLFGQDEPARALEGELENLPAPAGTARKEAPAGAALPARCSQCGAPLRASQVDWIDAVSAECPYCGTLLRV